MHKVTIGITCFNAAATIGRAIDSALAQDWPDREIVVVDDASTDGSVDVIVAYGTKVKFIRNMRNLGVAGASNRVIDVADGDFVAFFDDDDESAPDRLSRQVGEILASEASFPSAPVACFASGERIYPNGYTVRLTPPGLGDAPPMGTEMADYLLFFEKRPGIAYGGTPACAMMARTSTFRNLGGFDPEFRRVHDIDFCVRLALNGGRFIGCPGDLVRQYATTGNDKSAEAEADAWNRLLFKHRSYLKTRGVYGYATAWAKLRRAYFAGRRCAAVIALLGVLVANPWRGMRQFLATGLARLRHDRKRAA